MQELQICSTIHVHLDISFILLNNCNKYGNGPVNTSRCKLEEASKACKRIRFCRRLFYMIVRI